MTMPTKTPKLIVHETDCHGCGNIHFKGKTEYYSYDDSDSGDMRVAVQCLIRLGFIKKEQVLFFDDSDDHDIYSYIGNLEKTLEE